MNDSLIIKVKTMKNIIRYSQLFLMMLLVTKSIDAQDFNNYQASEAVMYEVNGNSQTGDKLSGVVVALLNDPNVLKVRLNIPYHSINYKTEDDAMSFQTLSSELTINVNPNQIQEYLTSGKTFVTHGSLTLNNITNPVKVEYMPLPAGTELDGYFNLSMIIQFKPGDFNVDEPYNDSIFVIKITDATVNRV
jgi:hypothetical protein